MAEVENLTMLGCRKPFGFGPGMRRKSSERPGSAAETHRNRIFYPYFAALYHIII
jgi:hypothetical protein